MADRRLNMKLERIRSGSGDRKDFIIADAKDPDMGGGRRAPGPVRDAEGRETGFWKTLPQFVEDVRAIVEQEIADIMLMSSSVMERLGPETFKESPVTPAIRANEATDIWGPRGSRYKSIPSRPFRTASLARARDLGCDLCLYSVTFNNDLEADLGSLEAYQTFREDARANGMRHFLEVFNPNVDCGLDASEIGDYVGDCILRTFAGLTRQERPLFLKIAFNGARPMRELSSYDPELVVGVLGGSAGTTRDTFELVSAAQGNGAWVVLFGRKIRLAESPLDMVRCMRKVADGSASPEEAVQLYHEALQRQGLQPARALDADLVVTEPALKQEA